MVYPFSGYREHIGNGRSEASIRKGRHFPQYFGSVLIAVSIVITNGTVGDDILWIEDAGVFHTEWIQDSLFEVILVLHASHLLDDSTEDNHSRIGITELCARLEKQILIVYQEESVIDFSELVPLFIIFLVCHIVRQTGGVIEEMFDLDLVLLIVRKVRQVLAQ